MANKFLWAMIPAAATATVTALVFRNSSLMPIFACTAGAVAAYLGWREASIANVNAAVDLVNQLGGPEALLDRHGREMLTLWIPLDHDLTETDRRSAKKLGSAFDKAQTPKVAGYCALETSSKKVGLVFHGKDVEEMVAAIRSHFQPRCPRRSYITRRYVPPRGSEFLGPEIWPTPALPFPVPLFEDEKLE